jgi:hypothetical protein
MSALDLVAAMERAARQLDVPIMDRVLPPDEERLTKTEREIIARELSRTKPWRRSKSSAKPR